MDKGLRNKNSYSLKFSKAITFSKHNINIKVKVKEDEVIVSNSNKTMAL